MTLGEAIQAVCWFLLLLGSVGWLAVGVTREWRRRHHRRRFPALRAFRAFSLRR
ncbi:hypothetical protein [Cryptosporangium sp. NPDC051539]|uniref:hypothetical protein n=1 Tax=Cryptosporangium sp. NPDC051539 TaxID=3363962 RepID=UPI00378C9D42